MAEEFIYPADRFLLLGKVIKPHGLRGELKIYPYSQQPENILDYKHCVLVNTKGELSPSLRLEKSRIQGKYAILTLGSVCNRDQAEELQGAGVLLDLQSLPEIGKDEYYWFQLHGLSVRTEQGEVLGKVKRIFSNGAQDIMVVGNDNHEYMIPILDSIILEQNEEGITISPPPGLLEMNSGVDK